MKLAVFDLCGTLVYGNSLFELARAYNPAGAKALFSLRTKLLDALGGKAFNPRRRLALSLLHGATEAELAEAAKRLYGWALPFRQEALRLLEGYRQDGFTLMLASAAPEPAVRAAAKLLGINLCVAAKLEYANGRCTGRLAYDPRGNKLACVRALGCETLAAVTDNLTDARLVLAAQKRDVFASARAARRWLRLGLRPCEIHPL